MTLAERLRSETRPQHEALESVLGMAQSREEHVAQLGAFLGFIEPWEQAMARSPLAEFYRGREKSPWLREDLQFFNYGPTELALLPRCRRFPAPDSPAAALGSLYVIEGSTLGGQMIAKHLETKLGFAAGDGYGYFRSYGAEVAKKWSEVRGLLAAPASPAAEDTVVKSGADTFAAMGEWFARQPTLR